MVTAVSAMMVDNNISTLNDPWDGSGESDAGSNCTTGTDNMDDFPDNNTVGTIKDNYLGGTGGASDGAGWILFGHDFVMDNADPATARINYMSLATANYCYTAAADGTVTQYETNGNLTSTQGPLPTSTPIPTPTLSPEDIIAEILGNAARPTVTPTLTPFVAESFFRLQVTVFPEKSGTVTWFPLPRPDGTYAEGELVVLEAYAAPGFEFAGWASDSVRTWANPTTVHMKANIDLMALFAPSTTTVTSVAQ